MSRAEQADVGVGNGKGLRLIGKCPQWQRKEKFL
jgi:hypothetical protein